ncbi:helix-turn-helix domain-containing protein [Pseudonocardia alni]|uniref:helix-turn-helix domain-containing protein n=1 Tax=Pseudonocardia alni TaxID=33907 RepID=UPI0033C7C12C
MPDEPWLSSPASSELELNTDLLGEVLREYRRTNKINQADLAQLLHLDQSYVSKIETGKRRVTDIEMLLRIAQQLNISPARLGLSDELLRPVSEPSDSRLVGDVDPVAVSQEKWRRTRRALNRSRRELAQRAADLYQPDVRVGDLTFLALPQWTPERPIPLDDIRLEWSDNPPPVSITGSEPEAAATLPLRAPGKSFPRYTSAVRYLDPPKLFENRTSYRLLDVDLRDDPRMTFGLAAYFDKLDLAEAIAHEMAIAAERAGKKLDWSELPLRALIGDPFDMERRYIIPAIETLTLRRNRETGGATFLLHWRDPAKVATSAGIYGLIPAGEFQPSTVASHDRHNDFSLWRNMVREYSEEILGDPERDGSSGEPLDYENWQLFRDIEAYRADGRVRPYSLGVGLDSLTLTATVLTVVVFDDDSFDSLFGNRVDFNAEGHLVGAAEDTSVSDGLPFTRECVAKLLREPMASPATCIVERAWRHRDLLLGVK